MPLIETASSFAGRSVREILDRHQEDFPVIGGLSLWFDGERQLEFNFEPRSGKTVVRPLKVEPKLAFASSHE